MENESVRIDIAVCHVPYYILALGNACNKQVDNPTLVLRYITFSNDAPMAILSWF